MISRRTFLEAAGAVCAAGMVSGGLGRAAWAAGGGDPLEWVDPRIGTGGHGHCFPGASLPFGAVQLSPDTFNDGWDWCSGYHVSDTSIMGFSHTHLSGTGCGDLLDFLVMPGVGEVKLKPGTREHPVGGYRSRFSHENEVMHPGFYSVLLDDPKVKAELTATERTGLHRYTWTGGGGGERWLIVDLAHSYLTNGGSSVYAAQVELREDGSLRGGHTTRAWGQDRECFFAMEFSEKPARVVLYSDDKEVPGARNSSGDNLKVVLHFSAGGGPLLVKTGISGVSAEGAAGNLQAEQPGWEFDRLRTAAETRWREQLGRVHAEFADPAQRKIFYTSLYHMSLGPQLFDDADGQYRGMDRTAHTLPAGEHNYTTFSLWDTFRAAHPAYTLLVPERVPHFANTLIRMAEQSEQGMPVWPLQGTETGTMTGYHSASVIAEAIAKGFPGIDAQRAYKVMRERAMVENFEGLGYYRELGYIPADREGESVSKTFEYCYNDWAVAHVAHKVGRSMETAQLQERSKNYKHYFNPQSQFMEPKLISGEWARPFDPIEMGHNPKRWRDYTESNAWQASFGIQHDPAGLIALYGGRDGFVKRLDMLFTVPSTLPPDAPPDIAGMVGQYAHGNEPSHHIAYLYVYAGTPWKTQARVRSLLDTMYHAEPDGMAGNEDVGQMSAWFLLSALGFYPVSPVDGIYVLGSPLVDHATVELGNGKELRIDVKRRNPKDPYVQGWTLNGHPDERAWFRHEEIAHGASLVIEMGPEPNEKFGADQAHLPPSLQLPGTVTVA